MASTNKALRAPVPEPRSGEDLVLQPLDPDEVLEKRRSQTRRGRAIAGAVTSLVGVVLAVFAAYRYRDSVILTKSRGTTAALPQREAELGENVLLTLDVPDELVMPLPKPPGVDRDPKKTERESPQTPIAPPALAPVTPRLDEHVKERAAGPKQSFNSPVLSDKLVTPKRDGDAKQRGADGLFPPKSIPAPSEPIEVVSAVQLRETKETITQMKTLIDRGDFVNAANTAHRFRDSNLELPTLNSNEYRELLKLQRTANEQIFKGRRPAHDTGDLEIAVIDHDLMDAYVRVDMSTFAREHFLNAERGYDRALSAARQREGAEPKVAKRDIQVIKENLGLLYARWAAYKLDYAILRKAEVAFWESEQLLDFAEDLTAAKRRLMDGKALIERTRGRLP